MVDDRLVRHVALLARLELSDAERSMYGAQLAAILKYVEMLGELGDLSAVEPFVHPAGSANVLRADEARPSPSKEEALSNAPEQTGDFFSVPRVIEE